MSVSIPFLHLRPRDTEEEPKHAESKSGEAKTSTTCFDTRIGLWVLPVLKLWLDLETSHHEPSPKSQIAYCRRFRWVREPSAWCTGRSNRKLWTPGWFLGGVLGWYRLGIVHYPIGFWRNLNTLLVCSWYPAIYCCTYSIIQVTLICWFGLVVWVFLLTLYFDQRKSANNLIKLKNNIFEKMKKSTHWRNIREMYQTLSVNIYLNSGKHQVKQWFGQAPQHPKATGPFCHPGRSTGQQGQNDASSTCWGAVQIQ